MNQGAVADAVYKLRQLLSQYPSSARIWVGLSGGLDSSALLWLLAKNVDRERITALHINHNLQAISGQWVTHCRELSVELGVRFQSINVSPDSSSEESARNARYNAFESVLDVGDLLLLGHHRGDQAETLIMRLFRGSGVHGLAAMPESRPLGKGVLLRPLLAIPRHELTQIVQDAELDWIDDPTNSQSDYLRNWTRLELGPLLFKRWPQWEKQLSRLAAHFTEVAQLNSDLALIDAGGRFVNPQPIALRSLPKYRLSNLIYAWLRHFKLQPSSQAQIEEIARHILTKDDSAAGQWLVDGVLIHLYQQKLWLDVQPLIPFKPVSLSLGAGDVELTNGRLDITESEQGVPMGLDVQVRVRCPGDTIRCSHGHQSIKKFMNEKRVPPWLRDFWPLIEYQGEIISVVGLWIADDFKIDGGLSLKWVH